MKPDRTKIDGAAAQDLTRGSWLRPRKRRILLAGALALVAAVVLGFWWSSQGLVLKGHSRLVSAMAFSSDGAILATGSWDETVCLWDPMTGKLLRRLTGGQGGVYALAFSPDGSRVFGAGFSGTISIWDVATGTLVGQLPGHGRDVVTSLDCHSCPRQS